jgi:hypothetical protein
MFSYTQSTTITNFSNPNPNPTISIAHKYTLSPLTTTTHHFTAKSATMSPTALTQQITHLLSELSHCLNLCTSVLQNRRLGSTHSALDTLQSTLTLSSQTISAEFSSLRNLIGSRMDLGDEVSRTAISRATRDLREDVVEKLEKIAFPREGRRGERAGFRELGRRVEGIEFEVSKILEGLGGRLRATKAERLTPTKPTAYHHGEGRRQDEVCISLKELDLLMAHMKNSWIEKVDSRGQRVWVNALDEKKIVLEKPEGFIKGMRVREKEARKVVRTPTWEQEQRQKESVRGEKRDDVWENGRGW